MTDTKKKILIVEDEAPLALALSNALEQEGFEVVIAKDGDDGMRQALQLHPDVILADLNLPKITGIDMIKQIREDEWGKTANVIILTNLSNPGTLEGAMAVGAFYYFIKSDSSMSDIVQAIKRQLGKS